LKLCKSEEGVESILTPKLMVYEFRDGEMEEVF
jgi:hypothetical protein